MNKNKKDTNKGNSYEKKGKTKPPRISQISNPKQGDSSDGKKK